MRTGSCTRLTCVFDRYSSLYISLTLYSLYQSFISRLRKSDDISSKLTDDTLLTTISELTYTHLNTLNDLRRRHNAAITKELAFFPASIAEYDAMVNPTAKDRVARFLALERDSGAKEKMLTESGWAWRMVEPLQGMYANNVRRSVWALCRR